MPCQYPHGRLFALYGGSNGNADIQKIPACLVSYGSVLRPVVLVRPEIRQNFDSVEDVEIVFFRNHTGNIKNSTDTKTDNDFFSTGFKMNIGSFKKQGVFYDFIDDFRRHSFLRPDNFGETGGERPAIENKKLFNVFRKRKNERNGFPRKDIPDHRHQFLIRRSGNGDENPTIFLRNERDLEFSGDLLRNFQNFFSGGTLALNVAERQIEFFGQSLAEIVFFDEIKRKNRLGKRNVAALGEFIGLRNFFLGEIIAIKKG